MSDNHFWVITGALRNSFRKISSSFIFLLLLLGSQANSQILTLKEAVVSAFKLPAEIITLPFNICKFIG
jgi:hypothetical protein